MQAENAIELLKSYLASEVRRKVDLVLNLATLTAKGQVTIPKAVREALGMKRGDVVSWELEDESGRLRVVPSIDQVYLRGVQAGLTEWSSDADVEAFADL